MTELYSKEIMKHFKHPRNVGKMKSYDGLGRVGNPTCGDVLWLYIKVGKNKNNEEIIKKASFETFGCTVAIANSSLITTMVKGKTLEEITKITREDLLKKLKKVPPIKMHCSVLAVDALVEAVYDYYSKSASRRKKEIPADLQKKQNIIQKSKNIIEKRYEKWAK